MKKFLLFISLILSTTISSFAADGFHTEGSKLLDANNNEFIMRGCNYSYAWQRGQEYSVIPAAKRIGCNTIRIQLSRGKNWQWCSEDDLNRLIRACEQNRLVCVLNTHDETGSNNVGDLLNAVNYWIEMKDILNAHASTVIVNISNEWYGDHDADEWAEGYLQAIPKLREAGINNTLMVDAAGWGQYPECIALRGKDVAAADSHNNIVFSAHLYDFAGADEKTALESIDYIMAPGVPAVVGEFAYEHHYLPVAYQTIMDYCTEKNVGYLVWSWTGNGDDAKACDMFGSYDDSYWLKNGELTVKGPNGIQETSKECSVFENDNPENFEPVYDETTGELIIGLPDYYFYDWADLPYHIPASMFKDATEKTELRIYYTTAWDGAELQLAYHHAATDEWTNYIDNKKIPQSGCEVVPLEKLLPHVQKSGFFVKGHHFTFNKATLYTPGDSGEEPKPDPDPEVTPDPDDPDNEEGEVTFVTPNVYFSDWKDEPYIIPASVFAEATADHELRIYYTDASGAEIQLAYYDLNNDDKWENYIDYKSISGSGREVVPLANLLPHVQKSGFAVKGHGFTFVKATLYLAPESGENPEPEPGPAPNPDDPDNEEGEVTIATPGVYFENWDTPHYTIPAEFFTNSTEDHELRIYYTAYSGAQIQLAYNNIYNNNEWTTIENAKNIYDSGREVIALGDILPHVQDSGFFVKGQNFSVDKVTLYSPNGGVAGCDAEILAPEAPVEYYNLQGVRVSEPAGGNIYIRRQGASVTKIRF